MTKADCKDLVEAGKATRFGVDWPGRRCLAKTRRSMSCQKAALKGRNRCRLHGGCSTGPRTPEGKARSIAAHTKHGLRSKAHVEKVKAINAELRRLPDEREKTLRKGAALLGLTQPQTRKVISNFGSGRESREDISNLVELAKRRASDGTFPDLDALLYEE